MPESGAEWLVEEGIGEHRAVRIEGGRIVAARVSWPDQANAGSVAEARLVARAKGSDRGTARMATGEELLLSHLPRAIAEGAMLAAEITREAVHAPGRLKRAQARPTGRAPATMTLAQRLSAQGHNVVPVRRFPGEEWDELIGEALAGETAFPGGSLLFAPTPALTAIDIDGTLPPRALAHAAVPALAVALRRFAIGGSVVVDFPTLAEKAERGAVDTALGTALADWPHERTAMNGFGLVQLVARFEGPSLLQRAVWQRPAFVWRQLLRRAEALDGAGMIELRIAPALSGAVRDDHLAALARRSGRLVRVARDPGLDPDAPHAQLVAHDD